MPNSRFIYAPCHEEFYATMFSTEADNIKWLLRDTNVVDLKAMSPSVKGGAVIYHGSSCGSFSKNRVNDDTIRIGRYMFEKDDYLQAKKRSPQKRDLDRIFNCCRKMDEVWVPTEWQRQIFARHIPDEKIFVIPEAVDPSLFDPNKKAKRPPSQVFQFLSIFAWSYRKGWEILLDGYFHAFRATDKVLLRIRATVPDFIGGDKNITTRIEERKGAFLGIYKGEYVGGFPAVVWEHADGKVQSREDMRDLLSSADAFVLSSRGEGWGLPVAEAMSMTLPVVVPNHTGFTAYCNENNSYLFAVDESKKDKIGFYKPDPLLLSEQLKKVKKESEQLSAGGLSKAKKIGMQAREDIVNLWSPETVVSQIAGRMNFLYEKKKGNW
jgi:glycosyltransferase involved in cell wall biosynthesis